jgi:predicted metal-dependent hydrolase
MDLGYIIVIIIIIIVFFFKNDIENFISRETICNKVDDRCYPVVKEYEDKIEASEALGHLNMFCIKLLKHMRKKYLWDKTGNQKYAYLVENLLINFNSDNIIENNPSSTVNTSYVEDKGKVFAVCLREKKTGNNGLISKVNKSLLEFVMMHEMAHLASYAIGHEDIEFWCNFKILLRNAEEIGIHKPVDYQRTPADYCGLHVDYNPYFDIDIPC